MWQYSEKGFHGGPRPRRAASASCPSGLRDTLSLTFLWFGLDRNPHVCRRPELADLGAHTIHPVLQGLRALWCRAAGLPSGPVAHRPRRNAFAGTGCGAQQPRGSAHLRWTPRASGRRRTCVRVLGLAPAVQRKWQLDRPGGKSRLHVPAAGPNSPAVRRTCVRPRGLRAPKGLRKGAVGLPSAVSRQHAGLNP